MQSLLLNFSEKHNKFNHFYVVQRNREDFIHKNKKGIIYIYNLLFSNFLIALLKIFSFLYLSSPN